MYGLFTYIKWICTVDGRNLAPPDKYETLSTNLNWLAGFLNHQQYGKLVGKCIIFGGPSP